MSKVVRFVPRSHGDWTFAERAGLAAVARRMGVRHAAACGLSDRGEPWCVVTDGAGEVVLHIARIDGRILAHEPMVDTTHDADTLAGALARLPSERTAAAWRTRRIDAQ
jgi:hypothetical protein